MDSPDVLYKRATYVDVDIVYNRSYFVCIVLVYHEVSRLSDLPLIPPLGFQYR